MGGKKDRVTEADLSFFVPDTASRVAEGGRGGHFLAMRSFNTTGDFQRPLACSATPLLQVPVMGSEGGGKAKRRNESVAWRRAE